MAEKKIKYDKPELQVLKALESLGYCGHGASDGEDCYNGTVAVTGCGTGGAD
ncbi:MAG: hypothetical protein ABIE84_00670 [bacterium]